MLNKIKELIKDKKTMAQISKEIDRSICFTRKFLRKNNLKTYAQLNMNKNGSFKTRPFCKKFDDFIVIKEYLNGNTTEDLAKRYNVTRSAIRKRLKFNNIKLRSSSESLKIKYKKYPNYIGFKKGKNNVSYGKSNIGSQNKGHWFWYKGIKFKSSYEYKFAIWCDKNKFKWKYEPKRFYFKDESTYCPDFYVNNEWIEIKGWLTKVGEKNLNNFRKEIGPIKVLFKNDLIKLGVLER